MFTIQTVYEIWTNGLVLWLDAQTNLSEHGVRTWLPRVIAEHGTENVRVVEQRPDLG